MTARLGSKYRYLGKLVLVPFRYFSIDIYRNIDIFDNTITFATDTPIVYTTPVFSRSKTETFKNAADPILV